MSKFQDEEQQEEEEEQSYHIKPQVWLRWCRSPRERRCCSLRLRVLGVLCARTHLSSPPPTHTKLMATTPRPNTHTQQPKKKVEKKWAAKEGALAGVMWRMT